MPALRFRHPTVTHGYLDGALRGSRVQAVGDAQGQADPGAGIGHLAVRFPAAAGTVGCVGRIGSGLCRDPRLHGFAMVAGTAAGEDSNADASRGHRSLCSPGGPPAPCGRRGGAGLTELSAGAAAAREAACVSLRRSRCQCAFAAYRAHHPSRHGTLWEHRGSCG